MNLIRAIHVRSYINRLFSPEAKQRLWQAGWALGKVVGESLLMLLFRLLIKDVVRDVLTVLVDKLFT